MIKKFISWSVYFLIMFAGTFLCFELWLRIDLMYIKADPFERLMLNHVHPRITKIWNDGYDKKKIFWGPPYHVFLNRGEDDKERMKTIHKHSVLPSGSWYTPNFLRSPNETETSSYQVTVNSLGFRSKEYSKEKPKDTIRIVALGSYPTFGSGVNDNETYSSYLENDLAQLTGKKVEVWNGGQQGVTAITGLARLKKEILDYQPDLLIWDFGWVDLYFGEDFVKDQKDQDFSYSAKQRVLQYIWRNFPQAAIFFRGIRSWKKDGADERKLAILNTWGPILYGPLWWPRPTYFLEGNPEYNHININSAIVKDRR